MSSKVRCALCFDYFAVEIALQEGEWCINCIHFISFVKDMYIYALISSSFSCVYPFLCTERILTYSAFLSLFFQVALILFSSLTETIGSVFQSHLTNLQPLLLKCLRDESSTRVRVAALKYVVSAFFSIHIICFDAVFRHFLILYFVLLLFVH